ncbi:glycosyltransferase family 4 protein [Haloferax chudinovii]|uniref:Glycosyltransferase family 4 protein n=1 Tax=Haloferax chudinovii TaxID=1109010 RepID=A0ABD5XIY4_9EURY
MHVCIISNLFPPEIIGGAEKHAQEDSIELEKRGHDVSVITTGSNVSSSKFTHESENGVDIYRFRPRNMYAPYGHQDEPFWKKPIQHIIDLWNPHAYRMVRKQLNTLDPDLIHIHNYSGLSGAVFSAAGSLEIPVVHTLHDYGSMHIRPDMFEDGEITEPGTLLRPYQELNNWLIENNVDIILSPSQFVISKYNSYGMFENVSCKRLPLGISAETRRETNCSERGGGNSKKRQILYVGQLTYSKGVDVLVEAVANLDSEDIDVHILGKGPQKSKLELMSADLENVHIHGFVPEDELKQMYLKADLTVVPSRWYDNSPMVIYESFAYGTPVIGSEIGGIPELIENGETGYLFEPENPKQLKNAIEISLGEIDILKDNLAGRTRTISNHVSELEQIYLDVSTAN